jgi:hypothetical protein
MAGVFAAATEMRVVSEMRHFGPIGSVARHASDCDHISSCRRRKTTILKSSWDAPFPAKAMNEHRHVLHHGCLRRYDN